jgi:hypothetical protein
VKLSDSAEARIIVIVTLLVVYAATLAPDVTLWDAGEFNAAIASLGIPHPPGTPLYILIGRAWAMALGFLPLALASNLLSAVSTAVACGLLAGLFARWTQSRLAGIAAGFSAGSMLAVWMNATETEIYALSLLLGVLMIVVGDRAGARDSMRDRVLLAYLMGLAIPLQISALVLAPAAIFLASTRADGRVRWRVALALGSVLLVVIAVSQGSLTLGLMGAVTGLATALGRGIAWPRRVEPVALAAVTIVGLSATLFMLVRAPHDPFINQGNPATFDAMVDVVTRQQYSLPGMWPRRAPVWIQAANLFQYADWQFASGLDNSVAASWWRTPFSLGALVLLAIGARWHWTRDRRSAQGTALLILGSTLGVVAVLNLSAGPSILDSVLPAGARHEPRERDYFFAWGFAGAGLWVGAGAVLAARRWLGERRLAAPVAIGLAALPMALNWRAATRRPDAMIAPTYGEALLASVPPRAVFLMAGDNDSYTVWFRQAVHAERLDVVPVTISLLGADWYRREIQRRHRLVDLSTADAWYGEPETLKALAAGARREGRPLAVSLSVSPSVRAQLAPAWTLSGMAYVASQDTVPRGDAIDLVRTRAVADLITQRMRVFPKGRDPASAYVARILRCPQSALQLGSQPSGSDADALLDSRCNLK